MTISLVQTYSKSHITSIDFISVMMIDARSMKMMAASYSIAVKIYHLKTSLLKNQNQIPITLDHKKISIGQDYLQT